MAKFLATQIKLGKITNDDVPDRLKEAVRDILDED